MYEKGKCEKITKKVSVILQIIFYLQSFLFRRIWECTSLAWQYLQIVRKRGRGRGRGEKRERIRMTGNEDREGEIRMGMRMKV